MPPYRYVAIRKWVQESFYRYGLFASKHPILMLVLSAAMILLCCYPLLDLPLPGSEPSCFYTPLMNLTDNNLFISHQAAEHDGLPTWFTSANHVGYIQQFIVKTTVRPWPGDSTAQLAAFHALVSTIFRLKDVIKEFKLGGVTLLDSCFIVSNTATKSNKQTKFLFPENSCLVISPARFWSGNESLFLKDQHVLKTIGHYAPKSIHSIPPSIEELFFGIPSRSNGIQSFTAKKGPHMLSYAITIVLNEHSPELLHALRQHLHHIYGKPVLSSDIMRCWDTHNHNSKKSCVKASELISHIHFKPQIQFSNLIPLMSTYFILGCYIYFSVRKINFVKSKLGMAFSAVISIMASLMISVGLCSLIGLTPTLNGGEMFPYLVSIVGLENILVITKSVVATPTHLDVEKRIALGLKREGCSILKNLLLECVLIGFGYTSLIPEIQEFCAFALVGVFSDFFMHTMFFVTVLSIDIRRLEISEDNYHHSSDDEMVGDERRYQNGTVGMYQEVTSSLRNGYLHNSAYLQIRHGGNTSLQGSSAHTLEIGSRKISILKIPKRLRVIFFFADTRMLQRGLMISMVIWFVLLMYSNPVGFVHSNNGSAGYKTPRVQLQSKLLEDISGVTDIVFDNKDVLSFERLSFRHWPSLFAPYKLSLDDRFISILPPILVPIVENFDYRDAPQQTPEVKISTESKSGRDYMGLAAVDIGGQQINLVGRYQLTGLDYYLTLMLGAVSGMLMVFLLNFLYRCLCSRNYANWRNRRAKKASEIGCDDAYSSAVGDCVPLVLAGHNHIVEVVDADGMSVASCDLSGEIRVWDAHSGECSCVVKRNFEPLTSSPNAGRDFLLCSETHQRKRSLDSTQLLTEQRPAIWTILIREQLVFAGCENGSIEIWDSISSMIKGLHDMRKPGVVHIACQQLRFVCARINGTLDFFNLQANDQLPVNPVLYRGQDKQRTGPSGGSDPMASSIKSITQFDNLQLVLTHTVKSAHQQPITALNMSLSRVVTGSSDHTLKVFASHDARCLQTMYGHSDAISALHVDAVEPVGAISGSDDGNVCVWHLHNGVRLHKLVEHRAPVTAVSASLAHVVSASHDEQVLIWSRRTGELMQLIELGSSSTHLCLLGDHWCVTGGKGSVSLWDIRSGELTRRVKVYSGALAPPTVTHLMSLGNLSLVCALGRELRVVMLPSVLEKND